MANFKKSKASKLLSGTSREDRDIPATILSAGDRLTEAPEPPETLSDGAKQEWEALAPVLVELGTVCRGDLRAFEQLCETLATQNELQAIVKDKGVLIETGVGGFKTNPAMRSLETARNQAGRLFTEFGITPKARNYVSRAPEKKKGEGIYDFLDTPGPRMIPR